VPQDAHAIGQESEDEELDSEEEEEEEEDTGEQVHASMVCLAYGLCRTLHKGTAAQAWSV